MEPDMARVERGAPLLGEHNDYVYRELLGLTQEQLDDLIARKVVD
jgi:crotonobetainyl-CoA:carnitine CoA-transferase CaiB-like acyl-CoA transferase